MTARLDIAAIRDGLERPLRGVLPYTIGVTVADVRALCARVEALEAALRGLLEVSACMNRCAPDDMTCASNVARAALGDAP
jgi:hypothetical protein